MPVYSIGVPFYSDGSRSRNFRFCSGVNGTLELRAGLVEAAEFKAAAQQRLGESPTPVSAFPSESSKSRKSLSYSARAFRFLGVEG